MLDVKRCFAFVYVCARQRVSLDSVAVVRSVPLSRPASASEVRQDEFVEKDMPCTFVKCP